MIGQEVENLIRSQLLDWEAAAHNYRQLAAVATKELLFDGFRLRAQFNPGRIRSTAAKVDARSVRERACFLCPENRPAEQRHMLYGDRYLLLVNPFPIFPRHLTIPDVCHLPQSIEGRIGDLLALSKDLPDYVVLYNGAKCGASAPDHFHFQAGGKGWLPFEEEAVGFTGKEVLLQSAMGTVYGMNRYLRKTLLLESRHADWLEETVDALFGLLRKGQATEEEPLLNILASYEKNGWRLSLFLRSKHRPLQYAEKGEKQFMFSPGAVDMGGLLIVVRETDFLRLDEALAGDLLSQVTYSDEAWKALVYQLKMKK